jgi:EAL domain-containing protein (putative c-di-GMP-specific phosphodiesterase class I)
MLVQSATDLGHNLGCHVTAEGVEDVATLEKLRNLGCDIAQGYLLARPLTAEALAEWIDAHQGDRASAHPSSTEALG